MQKNTENKKEYQILEGSLQKISEVVNYINEQKRKSENNIKLAEIQVLIDGSFNLVEDWRIFIREITARKLINFAKLEEEYKLFLFNDLVLGLRQVRDMILDQYLHISV